MPIIFSNWKRLNLYIFLFHIRHYWIRIFEKRHGNTTVMPLLENREVQSTDYFRPVYLGYFEGIPSNQERTRTKQASLFRVYKHRLAYHNFGAAYIITVVSHKLTGKEKIQMVPKIQTLKCSWRSA